MFKLVADNGSPDSLATKLRRKRFAFLNSFLSGLERPIAILDIGGTESYWKMMLQDPEDQISITLLNLEQVDVTLPNVTSIAGDARDLPINARHFDVIFSNSVIEHMTGPNGQAQMAAEVRCLGKPYFIQTPNRNFPLEPHFLFPFFQFLPIRVRVWLLRNFHLGWIPKTPELQKAHEIVESIHLLDKADFSALFPGAKIYEEKVLGLTKSFVAYDGWDE